jgi:bis(5'-nucleosidyl)-tetraphosphatase
LPQL